jgi:hypothetical protein
MLITSVISRVSLIPAQSRFYWKNRFLFYFYVKHKCFKIKMPPVFNVPIQNILKQEARYLLTSYQKNYQSEILLLNCTFYPDILNQNLYSVPIKKCLPAAG